MRKTKPHYYYLYFIVAVVVVAVWMVAALANPVLADHCADNELHVAVGLDGENCIPRGDTAATNPLMVYLSWIIRFLAGGVGLVVALMIIVGATQYIAAGGNPEAVSHAKKRITEALEALLLFIFMAVILNFIIPGGIL